MAGLPRSLSLWEEHIAATTAHQFRYEQEKTRLVLELRESTDQSVRNANAKVFTGRKWKAQAEVRKDGGRVLQGHRCVVGPKRKLDNLGWGCRLENQLVRLLENPKGFLIRSTYDTRLCPQNLHQWFGNKEYCSLCNTPNASFQHILSGCKTAFSQGHTTDGAMTRS